MTEVLNVVCFKWKPLPMYRSTFKAEHVNVLRSMVGRHYHKPHRFTCVTDDPAGIDADVQVVKLWEDFARVGNPWGRTNPSCYRRLKMFSKEARDMFGPRVLCLDLDSCLTDDVTPLWDRPEDFVCWGDTNPTTPYNGSMWLLRTGTRTHVWEDFDPKRSIREAKAKGYFGSDQAWLGVALGPDEPKWSTRDGVYSFRNHLRMSRERVLPEGCRIVLFHGRHDPWDPDVQRKFEWAREHWR